jgi:hypothetical protein
MKKLLFFTLLGWATAASAAGTTFTQWKFNSTTVDGLQTTGSTDPSTGTGVASTVGGVAGTFANLSAASSDPDIDNSKWRLAGFPPDGTSNKLCGVQFMVSTVGKEAIDISWDHYNSATGGRYWRVQYTTNGADFIDWVVRSNTVPTTFIPFTADFAGIPGAKNNANFGIRLVSEFENTAVGGSAKYVGCQTSGVYGTGGTLWLDMVTFNGLDYDPSNFQPSVSSINNVTTRVDTATAAIPFTISDDLTPAGNLTLTASSSNPSLANTFSFGRNGSSCTLTVTPEPGQLGSPIITVRATDEGGKYTETSFVLTILPANLSPTLSSISNQVVIAGTVTNIPFTITDPDVSADSLSYSLYSWNPEMIPTNILQIVGSGSSKSIKVTANATNLGATKISVIVTDGPYTVSNLFNLKIVQPNTIVNWTFNSAAPDTNTATGTFLPAVGTGTFSLIGVGTNSFGALGAGNVDQRTTDPAPIADNSTLRLAQFGLQGTSNKLDGVQMRFSTVGYQNIALTWDQQNSSSASRYWRVQYTLDGVNYVDHTVYSNILDGLTFPTGAKFTSIPGANNNPNFGVRIVAEFESTAIGNTNTNYVGVQASGGYGTNGTFWSDMYLVTGESYFAPPSLQVSKSGGNIQIAWPVTASGYILESVASLSAGAWQTAPEQPVQSNGQNLVTVPPSGTSRFFRLRK